MLGGGPFARSGVVTRIARVDSDQVACQACDLVFGRSAAGASARVALGHLVIVAPSVLRRRHGPAARGGLARTSFRSCFSAGPDRDAPGRGARWRTIKLSAVAGGCS